MNCKSLIAALFCCLAAAGAAHADRLALVMGNGGYQNSKPLKNAVNDARDVAQQLRDMGFDVYEGIDLPRREALHLVQTFSQRLRSTDTALFYFAGHATQIGAQNYLMPIDARSGSSEDLINSSINLQSVLTSLEHKARVRLVILDACRNNPFLTQDNVSRSSGADRGLFKMDAGVGSFIAYSTAPGSVAADGTGRNSPFTAALLRHMARPGDNIHAVMRRVRADVMAASNDTQIPWENSALIDEVFLAAAPAATTTTQQSAPVPKDLFQKTHNVFGLDPDGDGFLALRSGPGSQYQLLTMLTEGTPLRALDQSGRWMQVETPEGMLGWAHSNWIRAASVSVNPPVRNSGVDGVNQCDALWFQRNSIFAARGYCFQSARGKASFSNANCIPGMSAAQTPLTRAERDMVTTIRRRETELNCP